MDEQQFTGKRKCEHCGNKTPMEIVYRHNGVQTDPPDRHGYSWEEGWIHDLLRCPACQDFILVRSYFHEDVGDVGDEQILYPKSSQSRYSLPPSIGRAYEAAKRVQKIDPNAFGVLLGRLLELICADRKASGDTLNEQLADLAKRGEIPNTLSDVATGLRQLRNVGAHASLGELTEDDFPILDDLAKAILEYVYIAPQLAEASKKRFEDLKGKKKTSK